MKKACCFVFLFAFLFCTLSYSTARAADGVPQAVLDIRQSVVRILCQTDEITYTGSGFAIGPEEPIKYIVTNLHVVEPNPNSVTILRENNRTIPAKVYLRVENADLCVLLLDEALYGVPPLALADADEAAVGQAVFALGFPGAADELADAATGKPEDVTVTDGIISAVKSLTYVENGTPISLLQINAAINHGNSGGPLVDGKGHILGVNSLGVQDAQSINGAVSIRELTGALKERGVVYLSATEKAGFPVLLVVIIGGVFVLLCAAALVTLLIFRNKKRKTKQASAVPSVLLTAYLQQWGGKLPYDMAARLLAPVLNTLAAMHAAGRMHGDIFPEAITVDANSVQAALHTPETASSGSRLVLRPGFSAPEQYRADGRLGPWSDVYAICAVFYYVITGNAPQGVMERMAQGENDLSFGNTVDEEHAAALLAGLQLDAAHRPQNAVELLNMLGIAFVEEAHSPQAVQASEAPTGPVAAAKPEKKKMKKGKRLLIAGLATLAVLCVGTGGYYIYNDYMYNKALECINKQDYKGGIDNLSNVLRIFKSTAQWMKYTCAGYALQENDFHSARLWYTELADFQKSNEMLKEVDYQEAHYLLTEGDFEISKSIFTKLGEYKESKQMVYESNYQKAVSLLSKKELQEAQKIFKELGDYKDSLTMIIEAEYQKAILCLEENNTLAAYNTFILNPQYKDSSEYIDYLKNKLYEEAISFYRDHDFTESEYYFDTIGDYQNSMLYKTLLNARNMAMSDYAGMKQSFYKLTEMIYFEDTASLRISDKYIEYRLEGTWEGKYYERLTMKYSQKDEEWLLSTSLPYTDGKYYKIENCIIFYGDEIKGWKEAFGLSFTSENNLQVYSYKEDCYYSLYR